MATRAQLHAELIAFLRQHCPVQDQRHLVLLGWMVAGLLLSQTVCFDHWRSRLPLGRCLAASWQRRCQRWLANSRITPESLYGPLILWAIQDWQSPGQALHLALDTTMLWNRICVVVVSVVCHGRAIPLLWQAPEHPSASVSAAVSIGFWREPIGSWLGSGRSHCWPIGPSLARNCSAGWRTNPAGPM